MKKSILIAFGIIFAVIILVFLFSNGFQTISTDNNVYSLGEKILVHWSDFRLYKCTCMDPEIEFYRETLDGWKRIEIYPPYWRVICLNGTAEVGPEPCDVVQCSLDFSISNENYTWHSKIYERKGETNECTVPDWITVEFPILSYELVTAPTGKYKVKFGIVEKIFEIR